MFGLRAEAITCRRPESGKFPRRPLPNAKEGPKRMQKKEVCAMIEKIGIIPSIRSSSAEDAHFAAEAVTRGGIPIVEITMTVPGAIEVISHLARYHPNMLVGAGTVLNTETARLCLDAGASFLSTPGFKPAIVEFAAKENIAVLPGALTPTEILTAWEAGADFVKVFPCAQVGGDAYIKAVKTALPEIPLIAAGGVNQQTAANFILSGASAIGVGAELIPPESIERRQAQRIQELALRFTEFVKDARDRIAAGKKRASARKRSDIENCEAQ
jgi:2-dehydro-3-deoxyphosphogluconate aldolase/(4S)-4-hydroxy-2-oxoglutarate aldolase